MNNINSIKGTNNHVNYNFSPKHMEYEKYPEVYKVLHPIAAQMITDMENYYGNIELTDEVLNSMADGIVERSGLLNCDPMLDSAVDNTTMPDAVPVIGMHRNWDRERYWGNHNRSSLRDVASILLLGQIFGGRRSRWRW